MRKVIVVEGPDGAGKSHLVAKLQAFLGFETVHTGGPKTPEQLRKEVGIFESMATTPGREVIFDRVPQISEQVYAPVAGRLSPLPGPVLLDSLVRMRPVVIYCRLQNEKVMRQAVSLAAKPHKPKEHLDLVLERHPEVVRRYDELMENVSKVVPVLKYDWRVDPWPGLMQWLREA